MSWSDAATARLDDLLEQAVDAATREHWTRYLRGTASFRGLSMAGVRSAVRTVWREHELADRPFVLAAADGDIVRRAVALAAPAIFAFLRDKQYGAGLIAAVAVAAADRAVDRRLPHLPRLGTLQRTQRAASWHRHRGPRGVLTSARSRNCSLEPDGHPAAKPFKQALAEEGIPSRRFITATTRSSERPPRA